MLHHNYRQTVMQKLLFEDNKDIVFFKTFEEMEDKYKYYINNEEQLNRIARVGYENVRCFHNADLRAKRLAEIVLHHANGAKFNPRFNDIELFTDKKKTRLFPVPSQTNINEFEQFIPFMDEYEIKSILCCFDLFANPVKALEWGSGNSSIYFSSKLPPGSTWDSIEHNLQWANKVTNLLNELAIKNVHFHYVPNNCEFVTGDDGTYESFRDYILFPTKLGKKFQLIVVDGRARVECMQIGWMLLEDAGVMILHDAQRTMYYRGIPPDCFYLRIVNTRIDCEGNISTLFMSKSSNMIRKIEDSIQKILPKYIIISNNLPLASLPEVAKSESAPVVREGHLKEFNQLTPKIFTVETMSDLDKTKLQQTCFEARKKMVTGPNHLGANLLLKNAQGLLEGRELLAQGITELRSEEPERALRHFDRALTICPKLPNLHFAIATAYSQLEDIFSARKACEVELKLWPENDGAKRLLQRVNKAVNEYEVGKDHSPLPGSHFARAIALAQIGELGLARDACQAELKLQPGHDGTKRFLERIEQAIAEYNQFQGSSAEHKV